MRRGRGDASARDRQSGDARPPVRTSLGRSGIGQGRLAGACVGALEPDLGHPGRVPAFQVAAGYAGRGVERRRGVGSGAVPGRGRRQNEYARFCSPQRRTSSTPPTRRSSKRSTTRTSWPLRVSCSATTTPAWPRSSGSSRASAALRRTAGGEPDQTEQGRECEASRRGFVAQRDGPHGAGRRQRGPGRHGRRGPAPGARHVQRRSPALGRRHEFRAVGDCDPMPLWKSAPYLVHFMHNYKFNERLDEALRTHSRSCSRRCADMTRCS